jgi:diguanylate cyclase (GGDEF)-like protein
MRTIDIACRYGGEEIVIHTAAYGFDGANTAAQRLPRESRTTHIHRHDSPLTFTISIGVISVTENDNPTVDSLFQALDKQLYEAKNTGRNR